MALDRLDVDAPEVATRLRQATAEDLSAIVAIACRRAVEASALVDPLAQRALTALDSDRVGHDLAAAVTDLAARLDDAYFGAKERGDDVWLGFFHQARAAAALAFGLVAHDAATAAEAIYEAAHATEDTGTIYRAVVES